MSDVAPVGGYSMFSGGENLIRRVLGKARGPVETWFAHDVDSSIDLLAPQADAVAEYFTKLSVDQRTDQAYFELAVRPNYLAASHFPSALLSAVGGLQVGTEVGQGLFSGPKTPPELRVTKRLLINVPYENATRIAQLIRAARDDENIGTDLRKIEYLSVPKPAGKKTYDLKNQTLEAVINPEASANGARKQASPATLEKWIRWAERNGAVVDRDYIRVVGDLTFALVRTGDDTRAELLDFNPLRSLRPMPSLRPISTFGARSSGAVIAPPSLEPKSSTISVGVFDGGVDETVRDSAIFPDSDVILTTSAFHLPSLRHGAAVVGACMYGLVDEGDALDRPPARVASYRILPPVNVPNDAFCYWALDRIKEVIAKKQHDIYNISLGPRVPVDDQAVPNRWTSELDQLAYEHGVLLVVASGNDGDDLAAFRVQIPADMANGLAVGSCDRPAPSVKWERSPHSSFGPGRHGARIQPAVVQYGGSSAAPMPVIGADGLVRKDFGTSFSAPLVTHALADLSGRIDDASPEVLKSFAVHFAERPKPQRNLTQVGFGRAPLSFARHLTSGPDDVNVLYRDRAYRKVNVAYEIPTPRNNDRELNVRVTLVFTSPVDPADSLEYTLASLDLTLRPDMRVYDYTAPAGQQRSLQVEGSAEANRLEAIGWKRSRHPRSLSIDAVKTQVAGEGWLRAQGKWETTRQLRFKLKPAEYFDPQLYLNYLARKDGILVDEAPPVDFSMLVSVEDVEGRGDLNAEVQNKYPVLAPLIGIPGGQARV